MSGGGVGDVEGDGEKVVVRAEGCAGLGGVAGGGDDGVAGVQSGLGKVGAHAAGGAGDEPDSGGLLSHDPEVAGSNPAPATT